MFMFSVKCLQIFTCNHEFDVLRNKRVNSFFICIFFILQAVKFIKQKINIQKKLLLRLKLKMIKCRGKQI